MEITLHIGWPRHSRAIGLVIFLLTTQFAFFAPSFFGQAISAPNIGATIEPGLQFSCSWTIYKDGSTYLAWKGSGGGNSYSGTVAATVIQNAIDNLAPAGEPDPPGGNICFKAALFPLSTGLILRKYVRLIGEAYFKTELSATASMTRMIDMRGTSYNGLRDLTIDGENLAQITVDSSQTVISNRDHYFENVQILRSTLIGLDLTNSEGNWLYNVKMTGHADRALKAGGSLGFLQAVNSEFTGAVGFEAIAGTWSSGGEAPLHFINSGFSGSSYDILIRSNNLNVILDGIWTESTVAGLVSILADDNTGNIRLFIQNSLINQKSATGTNFDTSGSVTYKVYLYVKNTEFRSSGSFSIVGRSDLVVDLENVIKNKPIDDASYKFANENWGEVTGIACDSTGIKTSTVTHRVDGTPTTIQLTINDVSDEASRFTAPWSDTVGTMTFVFNIAITTAGAGGCTLQFMWHVAIVP